MTTEILNPTRTPFQILSCLFLCLGLSACGLPEEPKIGTLIMDIETSKYGEPKTEVITTPNGYDLAFFRYGDPEGRRVIFLHGTPGTSIAWYLMLAQMPDGFEIIAVDRPGWGGTKPRKVLPSLSEQAKALAPLLHTPGREPPIVVGWSYGGPVAAQTAIEFPDKVGGLLMVAASLDPQLEKTYFIQYLGRALAWVIPNHWDHANKELMHLEQQLAELQQQLPTITQDIEIIHGTADELVPYANVDYMRKAFKNAARVDVQTIENGIHHLPVFATEHIWTALLRLNGRADEALQREAALPQNCGGIAAHCLPEGVKLSPED